jgi:proteasome lid subunit RPN8/RPN11
MSTTVCVRLSRDARRDLFGHARAACPHEACGTLLGRVAASAVEIVRVERGTNRAPSPDRFDLDPLHVVAADHRARAEGLEIVGIWHSHPRDPAVPSALDRATASPVWSYAIVSLASPAPSIRCWRLAGGAFVEDDVAR